MKPLVDKKYIFARMLDGKPITIDMMTTTARQRYGTTRELFYETRVLRKIELDNHGRDTELTHEIHFIVPRGGKPYINILEPRRFTRDAYGKNNVHFLP